VPFYQRPVKNGKRGEDIFTRKIVDVVLSQSIISFEPHKKTTKWKDKSRKKWEGPSGRNRFFS